MTIEGIILKYKFNKDIILINQIGEEFISHNSKIWKLFIMKKKYNYQYQGDHFILIRKFIL